MAFFIVVARDKFGRSATRADTKPRHKDHLDAAAPNLRVLQSGPLLDDDEREIGSLLIFEADAIEAVEKFFARDPYVLAGLFDSYEVRRWLWRRGNPYLDPAFEVESHS